MRVRRAAIAATRADEFIKVGTTQAALPGVESNRLVRLVAGENIARTETDHVEGRKGSESE
jgi:hypothetical protein